MDFLVYQRGASGISGLGTEYTDLLMAEQVAKERDGVVYIRYALDIHSGLFDQIDTVKRALATDPMAYHCYLVGREHAEIEGE
jgi:hypothetical protein